MDNNDHNINVKELLAVIVALCLWGSQLAGSKYLVRSDNATTVQAISNHHSHSALIQQCLGIIWLLCAVSDLDLIAEHIPSYLNTIADLLSHWSKDPLAIEKFHCLPDANKFIFCDCPSNMFDLSFDISTIAL